MSPELLYTGLYAKAVYCFFSMQYEVRLNNATVYSTDKRHEAIGIAKKLEVSVYEAIKTAINEVTLEEVEENGNSLPGNA